MPKWSRTATSLLGLAICGGVIWVATTASPGTVPVNAAPPKPPPATTVLPPPSPSPKDTSETGQERVVSLVPLPPVAPPNREPATAAPPTDFQHRHAPTGAPPYGRQFPPWAPAFPPPAGTSPREFYLQCLRQAHDYGAQKAELTCQYLADSL
jgi:hypothetical protein